MATVVGTTIVTVVAVEEGEVERVARRVNVLPEVVILNGSQLEDDPVCVPVGSRVRHRMEDITYKLETMIRPAASGIDRNKRRPRKFRWTIPKLSR